MKLCRGHYIPDTHVGGAPAVVTRRHLRAATHYAFAAGLLSQVNQGGTNVQ